MTSFAEAIAPEVRRMREAGASWQHICRTLGTTHDTARRAVDPEYAAMRRLKNSTNRKAKRLSKPRTRENHVVEDHKNRPTAAEAAAAIASVPADTRGVTARMLGDPLPGRSALDKKGMPV